LQEALSNPADWTKIFDTQAVALGVHHSVRAYRFNMDVSQQPVQVTVDLSKKIGVVTTSVPKQDGTQ
jgi:hypothetical protein